MTEVLFDPDRELAFVQAVLADQEQAVSEFTERLRCVPRILASQNARLGRPLDEHDLADLTQDTVIVILNKLDQFGARAPLEAWVFRVCCLELMNCVRKKRRQPQLFDDAAEHLVDEEAQRAKDLMAEREAIYVALDRVGGVEAEAIRLKHIDELTFEEIGTRLGVSPNTAKTRYYRGLTRLEQILGQIQEGSLR